MERRVFRRGLINAFILLALTHILAASPGRQVGAVAPTSLAAAVGEALVAILDSQCIEHPSSK